MVLSDTDIHKYIAQGKIKITPPLPPEQFGSCSVDFRLGHEFSVFEHSRHPYIDLKDRTAIQELMRTIAVPPGEHFILQPHEFALAITEETLELDDDVLGRLEGRSSLGRIGIIVHGTAGLFDPGWSGNRGMFIEDLTCTLYSALGIDWTKSIANTPSGRLFEYVGSAAAGAFTSVDEVFG